jgi:hypothetical protein
MDIIDVARQSGMAVILDGRIGREEYLSVCGSLSALQRFADAVRDRTTNPKPGDRYERRRARPVSGD